MDILLGKFEHLDPRSLWKNEAGDFTPWLSEHLSLLGEALGLDLQLEQMESAVGEFSCDIVAREVGTNRPVIIENQLERTDHGHLGQLLTYAGGLDAAVVVWISPEARDEHRKALDWLNRHTDEEIDFFGVVVEAIRIDESKPAVQFRPVSFPNEWGKASAGKKEVSERNLIYRNFFQGLIDELREKYKFTNAKAALPQPWYWFSSGFTGIYYSCAFSRRGLQIELYIGTDSTEKNKAFFDWLFSRKAEVDTEVGESLLWERLDQRKASRICLIRPNISFSDAVNRKDELRKWSIDHLLRFKTVFAPKLAEAVSATAAALPALEPV